MADRDPLDLGADLLWSWLSQVAKTGASEDDCIRVLFQFSGSAMLEPLMTRELATAVLAVAETKGLIAYETRVAGRQTARFVFALGTLGRPGKSG